MADAQREHDAKLAEVQADYEQKMQQLERQLAQKTNQFLFKNVEVQDAYS